jgi:uncharacterized protein YqeY
MDLRSRIAMELETATAEGDGLRSATLRLLAAAIRDRDLARRAGGEGEGEGIDAAELRGMLARLAAQRRENAAAFERDGRLEQAADKLRQAEVIEEFLPRRLSDAEIGALIDATVAAEGARSLRDIGRVMGALRPELGEQLDPVALKARVRARLDRAG